MMYRIFLLIVLLGCLSGVKLSFAQDTNSARLVSSDTTGFRQRPLFGADLFLIVEFYGLHLGGPWSITEGFGPGAEIRIRPLLFGAIVGLCGDEGITYPHPRNLFSFYSFYGGIMIDGYRADIGEIHADDAMWGGMGNYATGFMGINKKWGSNTFFEPEVKMMFPFVVHYTLEPTRGQFIWMTRHYHLQDLFFAISLKVGFGFN